MTRVTKTFLVTAAGAAALLNFQGCTTTQSSSMVPGGTMTVQIPNLPETGFLSDYSVLRLAKTPQFAVNGRKVFLAPDADLSVYSKVIIEEPSTAFFQSTVNLSQDDMDRLSRYLGEWIRAKVKDRFLVVKEAGPDVLRIRSAITRFSLPDDVTAEEIKIADLGTLTNELEVTDSVTNKVLIAMVDQASGVRFTIAREDLTAQKEEFFDWLDGFHTKAAEGAFKAQTPGL